MGLSAYQTGTSNEAVAHLVFRKPAKSIFQLYGNIVGARVKLILNFQLGPGVPVHTQLESLEISPTGFVLCVRTSRCP